MKSVAFHNLGCKVNSYELDVMQQELIEKGYEIVPFSQKADIYIINTCTVTNIADRKSRQMLHKARQMNPEAVVVAVGCYVQTDTEGVLLDESVDLCVGNNRKKDLAKILEEYLSRREEGDDTPIRPENKTLDDTTIIDINHTDEYEEMTLKQTAEHTRAYIKIQDGCNQFCTYCAIPLARGRVRSRKKEDVLAEIKGIVAAGYKEVVLTGIHISSYGIDFGGKGYYDGESLLIDLVEEICQVDGLERVRLGSLEPRVVTEETAKRLAALPKLCPHFHLSLQSGCDETLQRMNRRYSAAEFLESVKALRSVFKHPGITTDVIVGFPGETEEEFRKTCAFLEQVEFFEMHIFKYSKRAKTKAAQMPNQVPEPVKTQRSNVLLEMEARHSKAFRADYLGQAVEVLFEECKKIDHTEYWIGHTKDYVKVAVAASAENLANCFKTVTVREFLTEEIVLAE